MRTSSSLGMVVLVVMVYLVGSCAMAADPYPAGAKGFAGMIVGKVVSKGEDQLNVEVTRIDRTWKHSKAESPDALVGKTVTVKLHPEAYAKKKSYLARVRHFFGLLKVGESDTFDVKNAEGDVLLFLELTKAQRERVEKAEEAGGEGAIK